MKNQKKLLNEELRKQKEINKELKDIDVLQKRLDKSKKKKKKKAPASVQNSIWYERMNERGVCQVTENVYSKTIKFDDISYQIAKEEDQHNIIRKYCSFLDAAEATTRIQISLFNRKINNEEVNNNILIPLKDELSDEEYRLTQSMNDVLRRKATEGSNSMIKEKYITIATINDDQADALRTLSLLEGDVKQTLSELGSTSYSLGGCERLELCNRILRPETHFDFSYSDLISSSLHTKDFIAPSGFDWSPKRYFRGNEDFYSTTLIIRNYPKVLNDKFLSALTDINANLVVTLHIEPVDHTTAENIVGIQRMLMENDKNKIQQRNLLKNIDVSVIPVELENSLANIEQFQNDLKDENMFKISLFVYTYENDFEALENNIMQICQVARKFKCDAQYLDYQQKEAMNSTLPLGLNRVNKSQRTMTTTSTAILIPFTTQELMHPHGIWYGNNAITRNMIMFNRRILPSPHGLIFAIPGSGKSLITKEEITQVALGSKDDILILDPQNEYIDLVKKLHGECIDVSSSSSTYLNPMDICVGYSADDKNPINFKTQFMHSLCELMLGGKEGLTPMQKSLIDKCTIECYENIANKLKSADKADMPTLRTLYTKLKAKTESKEAQDLAEIMSMYVDGSFNLFSHLTNVDIDNRIICYSIRDLDDSLRPLAMMIMLDNMWNRVISNFKQGKRTWLYVDEISLLFEHESTAAYFAYLWMKGRKFGLILTGITQNVSLVLASKIALTMVSNSQFMILLNQSHEDAEILAKHRKLSREQLKYIENAKPGDGLLLAAGAAVPFVGEFPKDNEIYKLISTNFNEVDVNAEI